MAEKTFDISTVYKPMAQQARAHASTAKYRLFGGAAGGGKTEWLIWEAILRSLNYKFPITGALFRRSYPELEATIIRRMLDVLPNWSYKYNKNAHLLTLFNGSRIEFCYAENDDDVIRYQSREFDWIGVDELTHFSEFRFLYLLSRLRTTKAIKVKFFAASNPGGIGHAWVKKRWISKDTDAPGYNPDEYEFIPAKVTDNLYLMRANPDYVNNLKMLPDNERRALLDGDWDVYQGQFFCFDDKTELLTEGGFVPIQNIKQGDILATRKNGALEYQPTLATWEYDYRGEMLTHSTENGIDFSVTPDHKMIVASRTGREKMVAAKDMSGEIWIPRTATWEGASPTIIKVPAKKYAKKQALEFAAGDFMELVGWYLSEGSLVRASKRRLLEGRSASPVLGITIAQTKPLGCRRIESLLEKMGIKYQYHGHGYEIRSTSIGQLFADYGNSYTKRIPREFLAYGPDLLQRLFDGLMYGDGHKTDSNGYVFATGSKQLGDDLMELATKLGLVATVSIRPAGRVARFLGRIVNAAETYVVSVSQPKRKYGLIKKEHIKRTRANGKVYCVTVENHTVFARRNGKAIWAGNTEWSLQRHVVPAFPIPDNWKLAMSWDDGTRAPRAVYVWAVDNDKHVWGIYEYYRKDEALLDAARNIKDELVKLGYWDRIEYLVVDPSMKKSDGNTSSVETLERLGFGFKRGEIILANNDRKEGWRVMRMYLSHKPYEEPMLKVFSHCSNLIRTLPEQIFYDGGTMGKREDLDTRGEDHAADSARYFLMTLTDSPLRLGGSSEFRLARREYRTKSSLIT